MDFNRIPRISKEPNWLHWNSNDFCEFLEFQSNSMDCIGIPPVCNGIPWISMEFHRSVVSVCLGDTTDSSDVSVCLGDTTDSPDVPVWETPQTHPMCLSVWQTPQTHPMCLSGRHHRRIPWIAMGFPGFQWNSRDLKGTPWDSMACL